MHHLCQHTCCASAGAWWQVAPMLTCTCRWSRSASPFDVLAWIVIPVGYPTLRALYSSISVRRHDYAELHTCSSSTSLCQRAMQCRGSFPAPLLCCGSTLTGAPPCSRCRHEGRQPLRAVLLPGRLSSSPAIL